MFTEDLKGTWRLESSDGAHSLSAFVPGLVQTSLINNGLLENPHIAQNELKSFWVGQLGWKYTRLIESTEDLATHRRVELVADGVDTFSRITLGGMEVGHTSNMFRRYVFDITEQIHAGNTELGVEIEPVLEHAKERAERQPYEIPAHLYKDHCRHFNMVRKCGCHFGWDWGPALTPCGIWRGIRIEAYDEAKIRDVSVRQEHLDGGDVKLHLKIWLSSNSGVSGKLNAKLGETSACATVQLNEGANVIELELHLNKPDKWFPIGMGAQARHKIEIEFEGSEGERSEYSFKLGLREVELVRKPDEDTEDDGESFYFRINGNAVFVRGANWIPADSFDDTITEERLRSLLGYALRANMNMVRVWGGGVYESEMFYDICDELGLMVWQDFMFACSLYPADEEYCQEVELEARHQLRRLSRHGCITIWCGNNEIEGALNWYECSRENRDLYIADYEKLFLGVLANATHEETSDVPYWPCSPASYLDKTGEPSKHSRGDLHYWEVWHGNKEFSDYLKVHPRFCSEFGFQSFPSLKALARVLGDDALSHDSDDMNFRQRSGRGNRTIVEHMSREFAPAKEFGDFIYLSQILQAVAMQTGIEHWRRQKPYCMGTLFWQLNDIWDAPTWSALEYDGQPKMLHYFARRFYAPLLISLSHDDNGMKVFLTNDSLQAEVGMVGLEVIDFAGELIAERTEEAEVGANSNGCVMTLTASEVKTLTKGRELKDVFVRMRFNSDNVVADNIHLFAAPKSLTLNSPEITHEIVELSKNKFSISLSSNNVALYVWLTSKADGRFSDNGFVVLRRLEVTNLEFCATDDITLEEFNTGLTIQNVFDSSEQ